jgi:hypothetical protein
MPKPPTNPPPLLRYDVKRVAVLARIPVNERELFCDYVCDTVKMVEKLDRRAVPSKPELPSLKLPRRRVPSTKLFAA